MNKQKITYYELSGEPNREETMAYPTHHLPGEKKWRAPEKGPWNAQDHVFRIGHRAIRSSDSDESISTAAKPQKSNRTTQDFSD